MRITMVGTSGSGKTVFSAAVYATLMRKDFQGFSIFPQGDGLAPMLLEAHRFNQDYKKLARYQWPEGTTGFSPYAFDLYHQHEKITNFDWIDYRGGFLDNPNIDPAKATELYANIAASNAVILFADGEKLSRAENPDQAAFDSGADAVMQVMRGFSSNYHNSKLTFLIALTKCDAVDDHWKGADYSYQPLIEHGLKAFYPLQSIFQYERLWRGGIIPISAMGEGTVNENNEIVKFIAPLHIEHVMAFSISSALRFEQSDMIKDFLNRSVDEKILAERYKGFLGALRLTYNFFQNTNNDQEVLRKLREEISNDLERLAKIYVPLEKLADIAMKKVRIIT